MIGGGSTRKNVIISNSLWTIASSCRKISIKLVKWKCEIGIISLSLVKSGLSVSSDCLRKLTGNSLWPEPLSWRQKRNLFMCAGTPCLDPTRISLPQMREVELLIVLFGLPNSNSTLIAKSFTRNNLLIGHRVSSISMNSSCASQIHIIYIKCSCTLTGCEWVYGTTFLSLIPHTWTWV
jgi:hypothetical protein